MVSHFTPISGGDDNENYTHAHKCLLSLNCSVEAFTSCVQCQLEERLGLQCCGFTIGGCMCTRYCKNKLPFSASCCVLYAFFFSGN